MPVPSRVTAAICALAFAASGCGGDALETPGSPESTSMVATLGDSITAGFPGPSPPESPPELGTDRPDQYQYWAHRADPTLRFDNCGIGGQETEQIASRLEECARDAEAIIIQGGANDILESLDSGAGASRAAVDEAATNLRAMVEEAKGLGLRVYLADVMPLGADPRQSALTAGPVARLNGLIRRLGREEDVPVLPFHATVESPSDPAVYRPSLTADGIHPSIEGYKRLGRMVASRLDGDGAQPPSAGTRAPPRSRAQPPGSFFADFAGVPAIR